MHKRSGQPWTFREERLLRKLFLQGKSINQIASELSREADAIVHKLLNLKIVGYKDDSQPHARYGYSWCPDEVEQLKSEYKEGLSVEQIAENHQRPKNGILHKLIEFKLFDFTDRKKLEQFSDKNNTIESGERIDIQDNENIGGNEMSFKETHVIKTVNENPTITGSLTGRNDAIFLKNKYQEELDKRWNAIVEMVHYSENKNTELKVVYAKIPGIKKNIEAHEKERAELYTNLNNVLTKETSFEDQMWKTTQKGRKVKSITVKQKFKDSDVDEMRYDSMMEYLKQYPEYASKSTFKKIVEKIEQKEAEIRKETDKYHEYISDYNFRINNFEKDIKKAEDKIEAYKRIKKEAEEKLADLKYNKTFLVKFRSERAKAEASLDLLRHRLEQFENTLNIIKDEHSQNKRKMFVDMEH